MTFEYKNAKNAEKQELFVNKDTNILSYKDINGIVIGLQAQGSIVTDNNTIIGDGTFLNPLIASTPTLQQVLDYNHDLVDGNNFQGTNAGANNSGTNVIAIGAAAAANNTGHYVASIGEKAAENNTGDNLITIGGVAGQSNTGNNVLAMGYFAAAGNTKDNVVALGYASGNNNAGENLIALGLSAGELNTGYDVTSIGRNAGTNNTGNDVTAIGRTAGQGNTLDNQFIISNFTLPSYLDYTTASAAISLGAVADNTYLYYDETENAIKAVRF